MLRSDLQIELCGLLPESGFCKIMCKTSAGLYIEDEIWNSLICIMYGIAVMCVRKPFSHLEGAVIVYHALVAVSQTFLDVTESAHSYRLAI